MNPSVPVGATPEEILRDEYHAAQEQFDRLKEEPGSRQEIQDCTHRYLRAMVRLRKYLSKGEVPADVANRVRIF